MGGREPVETELCGLKVTTTPLPFPKAQELLPEVAEVLSMAFGQMGVLVQAGLKPTDNLSSPDVIAKILPALGELARFLGNGRLASLATRVLYSTTVVVGEGSGKEILSLSKEKDRNQAFDEHPELYLPILVFAGSVTFQRFFPASARPEGAPEASGS